MTDRLLLRPEEVAELIGVGRTKVYELMGSGLIRSVKIGSSRRVPRIAVDEFVAGLIAAESDTITISFGVDT